MLTALGMQDFPNILAYANQVIQEMVLLAKKILPGVKIVDKMQNVLSTQKLEVIDAHVFQ